MEFDEVIITRAIFDEYSKTFLDYTDIDVALVGGGPANLVAAKYLADEGLKVAIYEKKISLGGGMWAGGMMFPRIVVQEEARCILDDFGIRHKEYQPGYYVANSVESVGKLIAGATSAGAEVFNLVSFEDVIIRENDKITGIVDQLGACYRTAPACGPSHDQHKTRNRWNRARCSCMQHNSPENTKCKD